jgi:ribosomal protein L16 Arg81 hydroxylase
MSNSVLDPHEVPLKSYWQRAPVLLKGRALEFAAGVDWVQRAKTWCRAPVKSRLFTLQDEVATGAARCALVPNPMTAYRYFERFAREGERLTLLLNHVDKVSMETVRLREALNIGRKWRHDDIVATVSTRDSGIGFHAGHEDGFIVQLSGAREWLVWDPDVLPEDYRLFLLGHPKKRTVATPPRPSRTADYRFALQQGDVLYLPALFGHEGRTVSLSVSLSIGWRGVNAWRLMSDALGSVDFDDSSISHRVALFDLIPDPTDEMAAGDYLSAIIERAADVLGIGDSQRLLVKEALARRFSGN